MLGQLAAGRGIDWVANLLRRGGGRLNIEIILPCSLGHKVFHHKLCHRAATDIAVTDKEYSFHWKKKKGGVDALRLYV
jgi:hypothetical protein